jgi:hypothetical protein
LAAAELQSFAGILQPHFHAHEITLKTNGTWPTQLFFAHPIKLFILLPSVFGLVGEIEVTKWESDDYLLIRNCLAHRNAAGFWSVPSISMVPIVSNVHYLHRLLFTESDNEFQIYLMRLFMNVFNDQIFLIKKATDKEKRIRRTKFRIRCLIRWTNCLLSNCVKS